MKSKYHTYLVVYMADIDGGTMYGNAVFATEATGNLLFMDAQCEAKHCTGRENVIVLNICKLD